MDILIVDDSHSILALIASIVDDLGYNSLAVNSGEKAVNVVNSLDYLPDLVILDINMNGMDGYQTATELKAIADVNHLPIIFLTGAKDPNIQAKCLSIGDDYIAKPFSVEMVIIKIKAHLRVSQLTKKMQEKNQELKRRDQEVINEHRIVESIFTNQLQKQINNPLIRYHMSPVSVFNGDVLLAANGPSSNSYILIGDATGHGLPAAVGAIPIYSAFRTMASKGLTVGTIAAELNRSLLQLLPDHMMLAATILEINTHSNQLFIWSGGLPDLIIANKEGAIKQRISSFHPPLAAVEGSEFSQRLQVYELEAHDNIYLFTDGIEESCNKDNEMFGEERLHGLFNGDGGDIFTRILDAHEQFTESTVQDDDITLVEFNYQPVANLHALSDKSKAAEQLLPWKLHFHLQPDDLRNTEPVPHIIRMIATASGMDVHQDFISTILSELFNNSLEHGLLELDSNMKNDTDGFINYYQMRRDRLEKLEYGYIDITIECIPSSTESCVNIEVNDSGKGYKVQDAPLHYGKENFGRGLLLIEKLSDQFFVSNGGKTTKVIYQLKPRN